MLNLGLILHENLSWKSHTEMVANKLSKEMGIINRFTYIYPEQELQNIYYSMYNIIYNICLKLIMDSYYGQQHIQQNIHNAKRDCHHHMYYNI